MARFAGLFILLAGLGLGAAGLTLAALDRFAGEAGEGRVSQVAGTAATLRAPSQAGESRVIVGPLAYDGKPPTPTPVPVTGQCYRTRVPADGANLRPAPAQSLFQGCQVVGYYGHPLNAGLGALGEGTDEQMIARLEKEAAAFDATNGGRAALPAFHVIAALALASPGPNGTYLSRLAAMEIERYVTLAEKHDFIVFLDVQMGTSTLAAELAPLKDFLQHPRVHLALDPEWTMPQGVAPGTQIGSMDASVINQAQQFLEAIAIEKSLPNKILVVHQFTVGMITNKASIKEFARVDLVIDMDGFGGAAAKIGGYNRYVRDDGAEHGGFKLFYDEDVGLLSAAEVNALIPQPDLVMYQ
jgi:hypothetical protein